MAIVEDLDADDTSTPDEGVSELPPAVASEGGQADPKDGEDAGERDTDSSDSGAPDATASTKETAADDGQGKKEEPSSEDRIIELHRTAREAGRERDSFKTRAETAERELETVAPMRQLFQLAQDDPLQAIFEFADAVDLDPDRVIQLIAEKKTGGDPKLTPEDEISRLRAKVEALEKGEKPEAKKEGEGEDTAAVRQRYLDGLQAHVEALPARYPLAAQDDKAAEAALEIIVQDWRDNHDKTGWQEMQLPAALDKVEQALRSMEVERLEKLGYKIERPTGQATETPAAKPTQSAQQQSKAAPAAPAGRGADRSANVVWLDDEDDDNDPLTPDAEIARRLQQSLA
jgi:hypothetical protein